MTATQPLLSHDRERFIDDLLGYMTLEEKLGQLDLAHSAQDPGLEAAIAAGRVGGVAGAPAPQRLQTLATEHSRLGIPLLISAAPADLPLSPWALAASWDEELAYRLGTAAAHDAARSGANCLLGPGLVIASAGPAPAETLVATSQAHLAARLSEAFARGAAHGEGGSRPLTLAISPIAGPEVATRRCSLDLAYRGAVLALDCPALDRETALKAEFTGLMPAECRRLMALLAEHFATTSARSPIEAAEKAIGDGVVGEHEIDGAVRGVLAVKHALGLFRRSGGSSSGLAANDEQPARADLVRRSMVLLRNEAGLLPLSPVSDRVLVVGPADGIGGTCADALSRAGIGHAIAPGLALRRAGESSTEPVAGDHFAQSLTRDAAQRADFVLVTLEDRHFLPRGDGPWRQPGRAVLNLLDALATTKSRLVALVATDEPIDLAAADQHFSAVLQCWRPAPGFAEALADILAGGYSPQGRLPVTAGRFEFGQGLGFGESVFSSFTLAAGTDHLAVSVRVRNSGSFAARETVQVYVRDPVGELRLVGFDHVTLAPGEDVPVHFELRLEALGELGPGHRLELAPGAREILVGKNIGRLLSARFDLSPALARTIRRQDSGGLRLAAG
jgi:beta-glucosidase